MQHKPRPPIHMEKQVGWACKLGGTVSLGFSKAGQTVLARSMESRIWHQLTGSVGGEFRKWTMASAHLDARLQFLPIYHWYLSSCYSGARAQRESVWVGESV